MEEYLRQECHQNEFLQKRKESNLKRPMARLNLLPKKECCKFILRIHAQLYKNKLARGPETAKLKLC